MAWNIIQRALLLGFLAQTALALVPAPTNVTLECHNIHNVLRWNYDQITPGLKFKVLVESESNPSVELWVNSSTLHVDLSSFSDPDDSYRVSVSAVMGDDMSPSSKGITYSYYQNAFVEQTCTVDFPTVNVTVLEDSVLHFRFMHPWLLYNTDPNLKKRRIPEFVYSVKVINQTKPPHQFSCETKVCEKKTIPVNSSQEKYCVHVEGTLNKISVQPTQDYCSSSPEQTPETSKLYIIIVVLVLILLIITITIMVCMKRMRPPSPMTLPEFLKFNGPKKEQFFPKRDQDDTCVVHVESGSPTHLLTSSDVSDSMLVGTPSIDYKGRPPIRAQMEDSDVDDQAEAIQEDVEESGYTKGNDLDEDSSQIQDSSGGTGYERRNVLE